MSNAQDSNSATSMALTTSSNQGAVFTQQGSVDWLKLGEMQFSASISILGRLASAGIDSLTVAYGQAMCSAIPLGIHGEKTLHAAVSKLYAVSGFGDVVWFGIGVQHIIRELVKTSQGSAMVALCAGLSEAYANDISALVLYELSKLSGSPNELTPSYAQWKALMKVTSSIFTTSTFGGRMEQLSRLSGLDRHQQFSPSDPRDLARVILAIGRVVKGELETVSVIGGSACAWIFAWAEFVLGLRIQVFSASEALIFANYDSKVDQAQLMIRFAADRPGGQIYHLGRTFVVRSGVEFIRECFGKDGLQAAAWLSDCTFSGGRIEWDSIFTTCFGADYTRLLRGNDEDTPFRAGILPDPSTLTNKAAFSRKLFIGSLIILRHSSECSRHATMMDFWNWNFEQFPELSPLRQEISRGTEGEYLHLSLSHTIWEEYCAAEEKMTFICRCHSCESTITHTVTQTRGFCLVAISDTIIKLLFLRSGLIFDTPLNPTRFGIQSLYNDSVGLGKKEHRPRNLEQLLYHLTSSADLSRFSKLVKLFCGENDRFSSPDSIRSAFSNGKIYAYIDPLNRLTDTAASSSLIHVGAGGIEFQSRSYDAIYDPHPTSEGGYPVRNLLRASDTSSFYQDTSTPGMVVAAKAEEQVDKLSFWYEISSRAGRITISPANLATKISEGSHYLLSVPNYSSSDVPLRSYLSEKLLIAEGEGDVGVMISNTCLLRPLSGNVLGRCIAISRCKGPLALVTNDRELQVFTQFWADKFDATPHGLSCHTLVS